MKKAKNLTMWAPHVFVSLFSVGETAHNANKEMVSLYSCKGFLASSCSIRSSSAVTNIVMIKKQLSIYNSLNNKSYQYIINAKGTKIHQTTLFTFQEQTISKLHVYFCWKADKRHLSIGRLLSMPIIHAILSSINNQITTFTNTSIQACYLIKQN